MMLKIKMSNIFPNEPLLRQTPSSSGIWGTCKFYINESIDECDYWVVYDGLMKQEIGICPPENLIFITGEPPDQRTYNKTFLSQFAKVITCHNINAPVNVVRTQQALPWHIGWNKLSLQSDDCLTYDDFKRMRPDSKSKLISVICSSQDRLPGHQRRLFFLNKLRNHFGSRIDIFGRGIRPVDDKLKAIAPYKYHIVLENSCIRDYWTEKLADTFLGFAFPIYSGCPNIKEYFPAESLEIIDIDNWEKGIAQVERIISSNMYNEAFPSMIKAREAVLDKYNLFAMLAEICKPITSEKPPKAVTIVPESYFPNTLETVRRKISRIPGYIRYFIRQKLQR
jgi:hypothetical protein